MAADFSNKKRRKTIFKIFWHSILFKFKLFTKHKKMIFLGFFGVADFQILFFSQWQFICLIKNLVKKIRKIVWHSQFSKFEFFTK